VCGITSPTAPLVTRAFWNGATQGLIIDAREMRSGDGAGRQLFPGKLCENQMNGLLCFALLMVFIRPTFPTRMNPTHVFPIWPRSFPLLRRIDGVRQKMRLPLARCRAITGPMQVAVRRTASEHGAEWSGEPIPMRITALRSQVAKGDESNNRFGMTNRLHRNEPASLSR
jgi:hypothetical protein